MKTSPKIHNGPLGGGISIPMKPDKQIVFPNSETLNKKHNWFKRLIIKKKLQFFIVNIGKINIPSVCSLFLRVEMLYYQSQMIS